MRLIDADALNDAFCAMDNTGADTFPVQIICEAIDESPTIEAEPVRHGRWIHGKRYYEMDECDCSECGQRMTTGAGQRMAYCPNCGAKMDKKEDKYD